MLKRPKPSDTEDDLLRFQQEFLAAQSAPAAKVVKVAKPQNQAVDKVDKDVVTFGELPQEFGHTSNLPQPSRVKPQTKRTEYMDDVEEAMEVNDQHITKVLTDIVEREIPAGPVCFPSATSHKGFPNVFHRSEVPEQTSQASGTKKKRSLFAQQFAQRSAKDYGVPESEKRVKQKRRKKRTGSPVFESPFAMGDAISGHGLNPKEAANEKQEIHRENAVKLSAMTQADILCAQTLLVETIDPGLLAYFKKRQPQEQKSQSMDTSTSPSPPPQQQHPSSERPKSPPSVDMPFKADKRWLHMHDIEYDKLAWTSELPSKCPQDTNTGKPVRFDFDGKIVAGDVEIPTHLGLHHHGDEPDRAGYTLEELFTLARSANLQQRSLALNTLAKIIHNARSGEFTDCTSVPLLPTLLDGGLIFIVRWALDDSTHSPLVAAVNCLHSLLVCQADEEAADQVFSWYGGHQAAALTCSLETDEDQGDADAPEETKKTDADLVREDVIKGLLRMSVLPRMRYLLSKWCPPAAVVLQILDILIRIARHSAEAAYQITQCSGLLEYIVTKLLPFDSSLPAAGSNYGYQMSHAVKLIRVICTAGKSMAASMVSDYGIMEKLTSYIIDSPSGLQLPAAEMEDVYVQSMRTWQVCVAYGLATQQYRDLYSVLMCKLLTHLNLDHSAHSASLHQAIALLSLLESVTITAAAATSAARHQLRSKSTVSPAVPSLDWSHVSGLLEPVQTCAEKCLLEFTTDYYQQKYALDYPASCVSYIARYLQLIDSQPGFDAVHTLEQLERLSSLTLQPVLDSQALTTVIAALCPQSVLLHSTKQSESSGSLPTLGGVSWSQSNCSLPFVLALCQLLLQVARLHKDLAPKLLAPMLCHDDLLVYIRRLCQQTGSPATAANYFARFENQLHYTLVQMARMVPSKIDTKLYHQLALSLIVHLHQGDEYMAHHLLSTILFNADFVSDLRDEPASSADLDDKLTVLPPLSSATQHSISISTTHLVHDTCKSLNNVRATYLSALAPLTASVQKSHNRAYNPLETDSLLLGQVGQVLVPIDWIFLPILELYNRTTQPSVQAVGEASVTGPLVSIVTDTLRWVFLLEHGRPHCLHSINLALKLSRIMCTFLAGSDLFLDRGVHAYLAAILRMYCRAVQLDRLNLSKPIPGVASFYDLYMLLLSQYEAVSYGDSLFGCYVLLPLQQQHDVLLRQAIWSEHEAVLRALFVPICEVPIPLARFLEPEETHVPLLKLYFRALLTATATPKWCPLLYLVAIHHTNRFMYTQDGKEEAVKISMLKRVLKENNKNLQHHLLYYKMPNVEAEYSMELYEELPERRQQLLQQIQSL